MNAISSSEVTRILLLVLAISLLIAGSCWTLLPFLSALVWAATIALATWPTLLWVQRFAFGKRWLAVAIMTFLVLLTFITPLALAVGSLLDAANRISTIVNDFSADKIGALPAWLVRLPVVGEHIARKWQALSAAGPDALAEAVRPYVRAAARWAMAAMGGVGNAVILIIFTVAIVAILYAKGEFAARGLLAFAYRLGGDTGERTLRLAGLAVRSVALGVVVTAFVQSVLAGLGLWAAGVPHAGLLTGLIFVLGIAQIGQAPIMLLAILWLYWRNQAAWATALLIWSLPVLALDNVLRPVLIKRGVQLPMLLIIAGVIGGLISFGLPGLFVGPVVLAATYALAKDWVARGLPDAAVK